MQTTRRITLVPFVASGTSVYWFLFMDDFISGGCPLEIVLINWTRLVIRPVRLQLGCANQANRFNFQATSHRLQRTQKQGDHTLYLTFAPYIWKLSCYRTPVWSSSLWLCCWLLYFSCCRWRPSWKLCREKNLHSSFGQGLLTSILDFPDNLSKMNVVLLQLQWPWGWDSTLNYITQTADQQRWRQWRLEAASQFEMRWSRDHSIAGRISIHHRNQVKIEF